MKKLSKIFTFVIVMLVMTIFVGCTSSTVDPAPPTETPSNNPEETPVVHTHTFSQDNANYCDGCESYIVKGVGSEYLQSGETANLLDEVIDTASPVDGVMNIIISGAVENKGFSSAGNSYAPKDLSKGADIVNIIGEGTDASLTLTGVYCTRYFAGDAKLNIENLTLGSERDLGGNDNWEWNLMTFDSNELLFKNCKFTEGVITAEQTKVTYDNCEFNMEENRYAIWLGASGYSDYSNYADNIEEVIIKECTFNTLRAVKSLTNGANIQIKNNTFNNLTGKPGIVLDSNTGELNTVLIENNTFNNCTKGKWNSTDNELYTSQYNSSYFSVTETGSIVNNE